MIFCLPCPHKEDRVSILLEILDELAEYVSCIRNIPLPEIVDFNLI